MKTFKKYTNEMKRQFGYFATWLPSTPIHLGDIGILKNNVFVPISNLSEEGIEFETKPDQTEEDISHTSKGGVSIIIKGAGSAIPEGSTLGKADAGISVSFGKENAILFKAKDTTSPSIKDQIKLGEEIIKRYKDGRWNKDWTVVTEVVNAKSGTVLISNSANSKIELKADGEISAAKLDIADASLKFGITFSKDVSTNIVAQENLTPMFRVKKVKGRFILPPVFKSRGVHSIDKITPEMAKKDQSLLVFEEADFEEFDEEE